MINIPKIVGKSINGIAAISPNTAGKLTLNLFCRPKEGRKYTSKESAFLDKSSWETLQLNGEKIQCYTWGDTGKKVLLAHGFNSNAARWRPLVGLLHGAGYQVIALDVPAHGKSGWTTVNGLLYASVVKVVMDYFQPEYVVGHSFAGIALSYYFTKLDFLPVKKIVFMGVPNELIDVTDVFFKELYLNEQVKQAYLKSFEDEFGHDIGYFTLSNFVKNIQFPGLIIHDEEDDIATFKGAEEIYENWKGAKFLKTKNLGHSLQGRIVYKAILEFLN